MVNCTEFFSLDLTSFFSDPDGDTLSYIVKRNNGSALPSWLGFSTKYIMSGIAAYSDREVLNMMVNVSDTAGGTISVPLSFYINAAPIDLGKIGSKLTMTQAKIYTVDFRQSFSDPNGDAMYFKADAPSWISITST